MGKIKGPKDMEDRRCTDTCCCFLFFVFWLGMTAVAYVAISSGDVTHLVFGSDYMGNRCGKGLLVDKPKLWYPRISQDVYEQSHALSSRKPWEIALYGICVEECPVVESHTRIKTIADYGFGKPVGHAKARSWAVDLSTTNMLNRCMPRETTTSSDLKLCSRPTCSQVMAEERVRGGLGERRSRPALICFDPTPGLLHAPGTRILRPHRIRCARRLVADHY